MSVKKLHDEHHMFQPDQHCLICIENKKAVAPPAGTKGFAVQPWVAFLPWKQQGTLFVALRGPDTGGTELTKPIVRWLRMLVLRNAAPHRAFAHPSKTHWKTVEEIVTENPYAFDYLPIHFFSHLKNALEVVGYSHPDDKIRARAHAGYVDLCKYLHDTPETREEMLERLKDEV